MRSVTVLMPVYNAEKFLAEAIDSILSQSFTDFEFLIIDDGSTDNSASIVRSYSDSRINLVQNEKNLGITKTLNKGIEIASGDLIARMDADDISYPDRLAQQHEYLTDHLDCCLVGTKVRIISEDGKSSWIDDSKAEYTYYNLAFHCSIYHPTVMFRKEIVTKAGGYVLPYAEDYELWCRLVKNNKLHVLPQVLLDYRMASSSISNAVSKDEYSQTEFNQIVANLRYLAGEHCDLPSNYIECFRYNYTPLLSEKSVSSIVACLQELDYITERILTKDNINRDKKLILEAAAYKKKQIVNHCVDKLPLHKAMALLVRLRLADTAKALRMRSIYYTKNS